jgi:type II secretory pathway pseudopilin PulG
MIRKHGRPGITLTEVLVAMFVMALGLLALLTLFPLGAFQMAQAIKDDRTSQAAMQADGYLRDYWRNNVVDPASATSDPILPAAFDRPNAKIGSTTNDALYHPTYNLDFNPRPALTPLVGTAGQPSYPVLVDPQGYTARSSSNAERFWVAGSLIPRRNLGIRLPPSDPNYTAVQPLGFRGLDTARGEPFQVCTLTDDMTFAASGTTPRDPTSGLPVVSRQGRYTWAAVVQRPQNEHASVATLHILVFDGRPPGLAVSGDEVAVTASLTVGDRAVTVTIPDRGGDQAPLVRRGGWLMDGTMSRVELKIPAVSPGVQGVDYVIARSANFYRIAGVTEVGSTGGATTYTLDLESPIRPMWNGAATALDTSSGPPVTVPLPYAAQLYFFAGLAEVFERPMLKPDRADAR